MHFEHDSGNVKLVSGFDLIVLVSLLRELPDPVEITDNTVPTCHMRPSTRLARGLG